jgi:glucose/arabinose dehydrogenase
MNSGRLALTGLIIVGALFGNTGYKIESVLVPPEVVPEVGGVGFTPGGELVVALRRHGILMAQPVEDAAAFPWRRFTADSLHNPLGLDVISGSEVLVSQMQEITRITDTDDDGVADLFETVADDWGVTGNYHETNAMTRDGQGGWYLALGTASHNGPTFYHTRGEFSAMGRLGRNFAAAPWKGWMVQVDATGKVAPFASGFRMHNGILRDAQGRLWATDNQGDWRGTSPLYLVEEGNFYGHPSSLVWDEEFAANVSDNPLQFYIDDWDAYEAHRTHAAVEFPQGSINNSPSEPVIDTTAGRFGPFAGQMLVGDIAGPRITRVMLEEVNGVMQGACVTFISGEALGGGNNRMVFSPEGNRLYVGQTYRGWSRHNAEGLKRVTYTGEVPFEVKHVSITKTGFKLTFTRPVDPGVISDLSQYTVKRFWYRSHYNYGGPQQDTTVLPVSRAIASPDGRSVDLIMDGVLPRHIVQFELGAELVSTSGHSIGNPTICYTVRSLR